MTLRGGGRWAKEKSKPERPPERGVTEMGSGSCGSGGDSRSHERNPLTADRQGKPPLWCCPYMAAHIGGELLVRDLSLVKCRIKRIIDKAFYVIQRPLFQFLNH